MSLRRRCHAQILALSHKVLVMLQDELARLKDTLQNVPLKPPGKLLTMQMKVTVNRSWISIFDPHCFWYLRTWRLTRQHQEHFSGLSSCSRSTAFPHVCIISSYGGVVPQVFQDLCQLQECFWRRHVMGHMLGSVGQYNQEEDGDVPSMSTKQPVPH